jgi:hypothetical protein
MNRLTRLALVSSFALSLCASCRPHSSTSSSSKPTDSDKSSSKSATARSDGSSKTAVASAPTTKPSAADSGGKGNIDALLSNPEPQKNSSGVLSVDLSGIDDEHAPALGGAGAPPPPPPPAGTKLSWVPMAGLQIPNPGWKKIDGKDVGIFMNPDQKSMILFSGFTTTQEGAQKVDLITKQMKMTNFQWKKAKPVVLGPNKVPALLGAGHAVASGGKGAKLFYALIKTGLPTNLLAIGAADDDAATQDFADSVNIVANLKK